MQLAVPCVLYVYVTFARSTDVLHGVGPQVPGITFMVFVSVSEHALAILNNGDKKTKEEKARMK
ncbi:MAG: hypothetical protein HY429_00575 [Candidatus Levybacteria bacterium]|nr:hypothetical protein [Candidatus Levybacteria bacterium]